MVTTKPASFFNPPESFVGYIAILMALITGIIHLILTSNVLNFNQFLAILFFVNGAGFIGGIFLYLSKIWRKELYIVAALYALVTIVAFFFFRGFSLEAFYGMDGSLNIFAVISKFVELILFICSIYMFNQSNS